MIGQTNNKSLIDKWKRDNSFPPLIIVTGDRGSGKSTLAKYIASKGVSGYIVESGNKVDEVREVISNSYKCSAPTTYIFHNVDKMSAQAKNALLKVTEEPPRRAHFILTAINENNVLPTLISRGTQLGIENYTKKELSNFTDDEQILSVAQTPGQINQLKEMNVNKFIKFCEKILDNIASVSGVNAFKIAYSFKFKDTQTEGYDLNLFFNTLQEICYNRIKEYNFNVEKLITAGKLANTIRLCTKYKNEINLTGVKKDSSFDMFILDLRDIWRR